MIKTKKKVICHVPTLNQFENIKPIEVKCFLDDNKIAIQTEKQQTDVTATMMTIIPQSKRLTRAPIKKEIVNKVTADIIISKPIRHLAILPSEKKESTKDSIKHGTDHLSETFTLYDGPTTTPNLDRSLDDTITIDNHNQISDSNFDIPINIESKINDTNLCDNTIASSVCELVDQSKIQQKPNSLIGRYQLSNIDSSSKSPPTVHIASVYYNENQPSDIVNKQILIQQFYTQLEKMKATFNTEHSEQTHQITTNTLTFDNGQVKQISATNQLKEKTSTVRVSNATLQQTTPKPPIPKKKRTIKNPSSRIQSAPILMATKSNIERISNSIKSCKQHRNDKILTQEKKTTNILHIKTKPIRRTESAPPTRINIHRSEVTLLPNDEQECQKMYEKLQRLQPNGVCVDLNTLRRALYPPIGTTTYTSNINHDQTSSFKSYRQRTEEMPQSWIKIDDKYVSKYIPKQENKNEINSNESNLLIPTDNTNIDRIIDQVKKHAAINYSYYTRTK